MASTTSPNWCAGDGIMAGWVHGHNTSHVGARDRPLSFSIIAAVTKPKRRYFPMLQPPTCCSRRGTKAREKIGPVLVAAAAPAASRLFPFAFWPGPGNWLAGCLGTNVDGRLDAIVVLVGKYSASYPAGSTLWSLIIAHPLPSDRASG